MSLLHRSCSPELQRKLQSGTLELWTQETARETVTKKNVGPKPWEKIARMTLTIKLDCLLASALAGKNAFVEDVYLPKAEMASAFYKAKDWCVLQ